MTRVMTDEYWMARAIENAERAQKLNMAPFACLVTDGIDIIGWGVGSETPVNPLKHSELIAITMACLHRGGLLRGCTLISTCEPCMLCCGGITHAKPSRVIWGCARADVPHYFKPRIIPATMLLQNTSEPPAIRGGVLRDQCAALFDGITPPREHDRPRIPEGHTA